MNSNNQNKYVHEFPAATAKADGGQAPHFFIVLRNYIQPHVSQISAFYLLALVIGLIAGAAATLLKFMIDSITNVVIETCHPTALNWWLLGLPICGLILTALFVRFLFGHRINHGVERMEAAIKESRVYLSTKLLFGAMVASSLTLGFGGSAGSEGPIATTGGAIGSNVAKWSGLNSRYTSILLSCGAAAGIAGIFKAPVGGMLFALEVLGLEFSTVAVIAIIISCLASFASAFVLSGGTPDISLHAIKSLEFIDYLWVIGLGLFTGLYSYYYSAVARHFGGYIDRINNNWKRILLSGFVGGTLLLLFPALFGEGYGILGKMLNDDITGLFHGSIFATFTTSETALLLSVVAIVLVKSFATSSATCGGVAGDYAPALFAGGCSGLLFALLLNHFFGADIPTGMSAYFGMAGVMSGTVKAPLMSCFLVMEMTGAYTLLLPLALVAMISWLIVKMIQNRTDSRFPR